MSQKSFQVAIDGPVGSGKSTVTKLVAERLGFLYVDTGAMYRAVTLLGIRSKIDFEDEESVVSLLRNVAIELRSPENEERDGRLVTVLLDKEDVSWQIRSQEVGRLVPRVAAMAQVRKLLVELQQEIALSQDVVMEGRDITYRVLPEANLKIYLTATAEVRAKRKQNELLGKGEEVDFDKVHSDLVKRDEMDMNREADPLQIVSGAWVLDTSNMKISEVVEAICQRVEEIKTGE